jgi:hypothetical protein
VDFLYLAKGPGIAREVLGLGRIDADGILRAELCTDATAHAGVIVLHGYLSLFVNGVYLVRTNFHTGSTFARHLCIDTYILVNGNTKSPNDWHYLASLLIEWLL